MPTLTSDYEAGEIEVNGITRVCGWWQHLLLDNVGESDLEVGRLDAPIKLQPGERILVRNTTGEQLLLQPARASCGGNQCTKRESNGSIY